MLMTTNYFHPVEYLAAFLIPGVIGKKLLFMCGIKTHLISYSLWINMGTFVALEAHSGYELPFGPMVWTDYLV